MHGSHWPNQKYAIVIVYTVFVTNVNHMHPSIPITLHGEHDDKLLHVDAVKDFVTWSAFPV